MSETMPPEFWQAVEQFNQGEFYACHDTLEALWLEEVDPLRRFYQGILQIAVGCYHLSHLNWRGAAVLLGEGMNRLRDYQPSYGGIEVTNLLEQSATLLQQLQALGPENVESLRQKLQAGQAGSEEEAIALSDTQPQSHWPQIVPAASS
jgi:predicted metal-dependent hydrolase